MAAILSTSFAAPVTDWAAQWSLASVTGVQVGHLCAAESELAQVTAVGPGTTVTVRRGVEATSAAAHASGTPVAVSVAGDVGTGAVPVAATTPILRQATVTLTHAQILALPTTAVTLVAAAGPTKVIIPLSGTLRSACVAPVTGIDAWADLNFTWPTKGLTTGGLQNRSTPLRSAVSQFLASTAGFTLLTFGFVLNLGTSSEYGLVSVSAPLPTNTALVLFGYDDVSPAWTGGHAANTISASVLYAVLDTSTGVWV